MNAVATRTIWGLAFLSATVLAPAVATAQGDAYARMSVSTAQVYDSNLFAAPASRDPQADLVSRFGPALEAGYLSMPLKLISTADLVRYAIRRGLVEP